MSLKTLCLSYNALKTQGATEVFRALAKVVLLLIIRSISSPHVPLA